MSIVRCQWSVVSFFPVIGKIWDRLNSICHLTDLTDVILSVTTSELQNSETTRSYQRTQNNFDDKNEYSNNRSTQMQEINLDRKGCW
jgi:hypothetical protein